MDFDYIELLSDTKFIALALASNKHIWLDIDNMYKENEYYYFEAYRNSIFFREKTFSIFPLDIEDKAIKIISILCSSVTSDDEFFLKTLNNIVRLIKKGYKPVINYYNRSNCIDFYKFIGFYKKKRGLEGLSFQSEVVFATVLLAFLITAGEDGGLEAKFEYIEDIDTFKSCLSYLHRTFIKTTFDELVEANSTVITKIEENNKYMLNITNEINIAEYINKIFNYEDNIFGSVGFRENFESYTKVRKRVNREGLCGKYLGASMGLLRALNIEPHILFEQYTITKKELYGIVQFLGENNKIIDSDILAFGIICYLFSKVLISELDKTKSLYRDNSKIKEMEQYREYKNNLKSKEEEIKLKVATLNSVNSKLKKENEDLKQELNKIELENRRIKQELAENKINKIELQQLREFMFNLDNKVLFEQDVYSINYSLLNSTKIAILGGHPNWQNKMKEVLENSIFISPENINFDIKLLDNIDLVVFYTNYLNHSMYYKVIDYIRDKNINHDYLESTTNISLSLKRLEYIINKKS